MCIHLYHGRFVYILGCMPAKNRVKPYVANGYYYIYNSGIDKREIFSDDKDFKVFLNLLKTYLTPPGDLRQENLGSKFKSERPYKIKHREQMNLAGQVHLQAYCLMPTRFQLLVQQVGTDGIIKLMRRLCTSYVTYYNKRHARQGSLFQGVYKGELISDPQRLQEIRQHIHQEPISVRKIGLISTSTGSAAEYPYSSYHNYLANTAPSWLTLGPTLSD